MHTPAEHLFAVSLKPGDRALTDFSYGNSRLTHMTPVTITHKASMAGETGICYRCDGPAGWLDAHWFWPLDKA